MTDIVSSDWFVGLESVDGHSYDRLVIGLDSPGHGAAGWTPLARLRPELNICGLRLPGRETRILEEPFNSMDSLVAQVNQAIAETFPALCSLHLVAVCLNSKTACEIARAAEARDLDCNVQLTLIDPTLSTKDVPTPWTSMSLESLTERLRSEFDVPAEILDDPLVLEVFEPMLRADFAITESAVLPQHSFLRSDIQIIYTDAQKRDDEVLRRQCRNLTTGAVTFELISASSGMVLKQPDLLATALFGEK